MSLTDNALKTKLVNINKAITKREQRKGSMMSECITTKLDNSLELYERDLLETCRYVMMRNPVIMTKDFTILGETNRKDVNNGN